MYSIESSICTYIFIIIQQAKDETLEDEDAAVEEEKEEEDKPKTKKVNKTTWDWELINNSKPIWTRKPAEIEEDEYSEFYKSITKDSEEHLTHTHFVAEGEVTFKSLLFIPKVQPAERYVFRLRAAAGSLVGPYFLYCSHASDCHRGRSLW